MSEAILRHRELCWFKRGLLAAVAFGGSAIYAWSFNHVPQRDQWLPLARAIGIAAGTSWVLFGLVLLLVTRAKPTIMAWADTCLITMGAGMAIKMTTVAVNCFATPNAPLHLTVLVAANFLMAAVFILRAKPLCLRPLAAAGLWFGALNGIFAIILFGLRAIGWWA